MANEILIEERDFRLYAVIPPHLDFSRFETSILKAQRGEVRQYLGGGLYRDLHVNQTDAKYVSLLDGSTYSWQGQTVDFFGLKPAIVLYAYAHYLNDNDLRVTRAGNKIMDTDISENATPEMIEAEYTKALSSALGYLVETGRFLDDNTSTYTLWQGAQGTATKGTMISSSSNARFGRSNKYNKENYYGWR